MSRIGFIHRVEVHPQLFWQLQCHFDPNTAVYSDGTVRASSDGYRPHSESVPHSILVILN